MLEPTSKNKSEIVDLISQHHTSMSQYQIDNFVVGEKMTPYRILKQILLELETRYKNQKLFETDCKIELLEIQQLKNKLSVIDDKIEKEILELKIQRRELELVALEKNKSNIDYEIEVLENQYNILKEKNENMLDVLNDESGEEEYWINKFIKEAQVDIMTTGRVGKGVLDAIMSLPTEIQNLIIQNAVGQATNSNTYISAVEDHYIQQIREDKQSKLMLDTLVKKVE